mmetsp:Transcript_15867/g.25398  ORF Transcript_15867/g.25398 Transcript_15867/m.25398 type:complete len:179 (+) Transcript_15867:783-1319(+)
MEGGLQLFIFHFVRIPPELVHNFSSRRRISFLQILLSWGYNLKKKDVSNGFPPTTTTKVSFYILPFQGADAVIEVCQWCVWPYNLASLGKIVPFAFRDAIYRTVAGERYKWFGTQPLDENFAKYLCPYYYMNKKAFDEKAQKRALEAEKRRKEIAKTMKMAEAEVERKAALSKKGKTE